MRIRSAAPLLVTSILALLTGCRIEQTPARYIDHLETPQEEIAASQDELTDRLLSTGIALQRRDLQNVVSALAPQAGVHVIGMDRDPLTDGSAIGFALSDLAIGQPVSVRDLSVEVGPGNTVAWFRLSYEVDREDDGPESIRFSGIFRRQEGEWRLVQGHVSVPVSPPADSVPAEQAVEGAG